MRACVCVCACVCVYFIFAEKGVFSVWACMQFSLQRNFQVWFSLGNPLVAKSTEWRNCVVPISSLCPQLCHLTSSQLCNRPRTNPRLATGQFHWFNFQGLWQNPLEAQVVLGRTRWNPATIQVSFEMSVVLSQLDLDFPLVLLCQGIQMSLKKKKNRERRLFVKKDPSTSCHCSPLPSCLLPGSLISKFLRLSVSPGTCRVLVKLNVPQEMFILSPPGLTPQPRALRS